MIFNKNIWFNKYKYLSCDNKVIIKLHGIALLSYTFLRKIAFLYIKSEYKFWIGLLKKDCKDTNLVFLIFVHAYVTFVIICINYE